MLREGRWADHKAIYGSCLVGRTLGSVGVGNIGAEMMRLLVEDKSALKVFVNVSDGYLSLTKFISMMSMLRPICVRTPSLR